MMKRLERVRLLHRQALSLLHDETSIITRELMNSCHSSYFATLSWHLISSPHLIFIFIILGLQCVYYNNKYNMNYIIIITTIVSVVKILEQGSQSSNNRSSTAHSTPDSLAAADDSWSHNQKRDSCQWSTSWKVSVASPHRWPVSFQVWGFSRLFFFFFSFLFELCRHVVETHTCSSE